ncbi:helix-turn-helix domain-containing protein [Oceanimonas sp. NS1]|nr:helix-turn-helix domain-containing protein [Oceanimonas sp. NS1]
MTTNEEQQQAGEEQQAPTSGPGALLRQAREGRGWSQNEVARRLNLRVAVIESLDSDQYKAGVALTFLRGYVKAYARLVGVSEQQALAALTAWQAWSNGARMPPCRCRAFPKDPAAGQ